MRLVNVRRATHSGWYHSHSWGPGLYKKEESELSTGIPQPQLPDYEGTVTSSLGFLQSELLHHEGPHPGTESR